MFDIFVDEFATPFSQVPAVVAATRLFAAMTFGGIIGFEREWRNKAAGLRTHMLVSIAACLFTLVGLEISSLEFGGNDDKRVDPLRLIEATTAGVAFLAAGLIFTAGGKVKNVTTGASLWLAGAIGLACGAGQMPLAAMATVIVVIVVGVVGLFERRHDEDET
ncbi:putative Mg2+ transporter-C (MgtC) family protein [Palleronia marisminoris]|uniref:Protein MgtC n=1 Tax=Palleronia marisminoris TaxID=315423 RepID=A0A1Y5SU95_9RHOB|nr:MgtC/SapB family protein [Palleronia marisminoris]SFG99541.1 putative Mg2+ transporter-C (MgtC) family protein [Palleronia marisminoris]SLN48572.1 putative Mg(2+) transport ATPase [Palleronia marisminoris]